MWMGTRTAGMRRWTADRIDSVEISSGFHSHAIHGVVEDEGGHWWLATDRGVIRVAPEELSAVADGVDSKLDCQLIATQDGMASSECSSGYQPVCGRDQSGRLWFATNKGVAVVDPFRFRLNDQPPPVHIEEISYLDRPTEDDGTADGRENRNRIRSLKGKSIELPSGSRGIEIRYTGITFTNPEEVRFRVMLEGHDGVWHDMGRDRSIAYYDLSPGEYTFRVQAANNDGVWNEQGAELAFVLAPYLWQTWWFRIVGLIALAVFSGGISWYAAHAHQRRRQREDALFRLVVEAAPAAILLVELDGAISLVNSRAIQEFGFVRDELIGRPIEMLVPGSSRELHRKLRIDYAADPTSLSLGVGRELTARRNDRSEFPVEVSLNLIRQNHRMSVRVSIQNISERKQNERELAAQRNELARLSRAIMLGELSGSLAHELNQPLTAILSNAQAAQQLINRDPIDLQEVREILSDIVKEDKQAGETIRRLRALFSKGNTQHQIIDLNDVIRDVMRLMRSGLIELHVEPVTEIPDLPGVNGDHVQLQQVLLNLLLNACEAMHDLPPQNRRLIVRAGSDEDRVWVGVADAGHGIPTEDFARLMDPFFTTKEDGMGLGLAVVRHIIDSHRGQVWAENNEDGGATVYFSIPRRSGGERSEHQRADRVSGG